MKVLLATDGSDQARATTDLLYRLVPAEAEVILCSVAGESELPSDDSAPGALSQLNEALRAEVDRLLDSEARRLEKAGYEVVVVSRQGDAADQITQAAAELEVDLVAVGSRGLGRFREYLLGSVSQRVVRHSPCSVLLGRPVPEGDEGPEPGSLRVVLALDGSDQSRVAARSLARLAGHGRFEVQCVQVIPAERDWGVDLARHMAEVRRRDEQEAIQFLRQTAAMLQTAGAQASSHLLVGEDPAGELIEHARRESAELLVIGNRGITSIDRFLLGSVCHKLAHHAPCPVLLVKGEGLPA